ncbi:MAG: hypothetical protein QXG86_01080 [Candidatus Woesearchaeota archaeon]
MKNKFMRFLFIFFITLVSIQFVLGVPSWKQQTTPAQSKKTPQQPQIVTQTTIIIQNNTAQPQEEKGINWEFIGAISGVIAIIAAFIGWFLTKKGRSRASDYIKNINETYNKYKNDASKCETELYRMKEQLEVDFSKGRISEESFNMLDSRIDKYLSEVRKGIVTTFEISPKLKKELHKMLKDGVISEEEYKEFLRMDLSDISRRDREKIEHYINKWRKKNK